MAYREPAVVEPDPPKPSKPKPKPGAKSWMLVDPDVPGPVPFGIRGFFLVFLIGLAVLALMGASSRYVLSW